MKVVDDIRWKIAKMRHETTQIKLKIRKCISYFCFRYVLSMLKSFISIRSRRRFWTSNKIHYDIIIKWSHIPTPPSPTCNQINPINNSFNIIISALLILDRRGCGDRGFPSKRSPLPTATPLGSHLSEILFCYFRDSQHPESFTMSVLHALIIKLLNVLLTL